LAILLSSLCRAFHLGGATKSYPVSFIWVSLGIVIKGV
jgi:hypothetical protein